MTDLINWIYNLSLWQFVFFMLCIYFWRTVLALIILVVTAVTSGVIASLVFIADVCGNVWDKIRGDKNGR